MTRLLGPVIDATPRPLPARVPLRGQHAVLEPLHRRHAHELWDAAQGATATWGYMGYGPFPDAGATAAFVAEFAYAHDPMAWAARHDAIQGWLDPANLTPDGTARRGLAQIRAATSAA